MTDAESYRKAMTKHTAALNGKILRPPEPARASKQAAVHAINEELGEIAGGLFDLNKRLYDLKLAVAELIK